MRTLPIGRICAKEEQKQVTDHRRYWQIQLENHHKLGLNITFLKINLRYFSDQFFPEFYFFRRSKFPKTLPCTREYIYIEFFNTIEFSVAPYQGFGPYCGQHAQWSFFSTGLSQIHLRTSGHRNNAFEIVYQPIDLGYIVTRSVFTEPAVWLTSDDQEYQYQLTLVPEPPSAFATDINTGGFNNPNEHHNTKAVKQ